MKVLLKYPSRQRPAQFIENVKRWEAKLSNEIEYVWLFSFDTDDETMKNVDLSFVQRKYEVFWDKPRGKIAACNAGVNEFLDNSNNQDFDMIWLVSDDMRPTESGFDLRIEREMYSHYPNWDGAVHIHDGLQGIRLCTFSCMGMKYYKRFNYIYHPQYQSTHCDDEFTQIAWANRRMIWIPDVLVRHEWIGHTDPTDALHQKNHALMTSVDAQTYQKRASAGFPKSNVN
jgi:hypothetical protein